VPDLYIFAFVISSTVFFDNVNWGKGNRRSPYIVCAFLLGCLCATQYALLLPVGSSAASMNDFEIVAFFLFLGASILNGYLAGVRSAQSVAARRRASS
jgi:hypothetical protein